MADTEKSSHITDHPFRPRLGHAFSQPAQADYPETWRGPSLYLCGHQGCNMAEAAHRETTVTRAAVDEMRYCSVHGLTRETHCGASLGSDGQGPVFCQRETTVKR